MPRGAPVNAVSLLPSGFLPGINCTKVSPLPAAGATFFTLTQYQLACALAVNNRLSENTLNVYARTLNGLLVYMRISLFNR